MQAGCQLERASEEGCWAVSTDLRERARDAEPCLRSAYSGHALRGRLQARSAATEWLVERGRERVAGRPPALALLRHMSTSTSVHTVYDLRPFSHRRCEAATGRSSTA
jgi:hypothetical protein